MLHCGLYMVKHQGYSLKALSAVCSVGATAQAVWAYGAQKCGGALHTCRTVAAAVLTTLSELLFFSFAKSLKHVPNTIAVPSCIQVAKVQLLVYM